LKYAEETVYDFCDISESVLDALCGIRIGSCAGVDETLSALNRPDFIYSDGAPGGSRAKAAFLNVLLFLRGQLQNERPWKITEEFIADLGDKYIWFVTANSRFLGEFWADGAERSRRPARSARIARNRFGEQ
jgi:hypothetical protein